MSNNSGNKDEEEGTPIAVTVSPSSSTPVVSAQPYQPYPQTPYAPYNDDQRRAAASSYYVIIPFRGNDFDENLLMAAALSRSMRLLAIFDMFLLCLLAIWNLFFLLGLWGPISGYYGAKQFRKDLVYVYALYWFVRSVFDLLIILGGTWWFILSLCIDLYIFSYVWTFAKTLGALNDNELSRLRDPPDDILLVRS